MAAAGEGRRRGTARGSRSVAATAAGSGAAAAAQILQQPHTTPHRLGRSTRRSRTSDGIGSATRRTHARPSSDESLGSHNVNVGYSVGRPGRRSGHTICPTNTTKIQTGRVSRRGSRSNYAANTLAITLPIDDDDSDEVDSDGEDEDEVIEMPPLVTKGYVSDNNESENEDHLPAAARHKSSTKSTPTTNLPTDAKRKLSSTKSNHPTSRSGLSLRSIGLKVLGFDDKRQQKVCDRTNNERFSASFGVSANTLDKVFIDMKKKDANLTEQDFLMGVNTLKLYLTEHNMAGRWQCCEEVYRKKWKKVVAAIAALRGQKIKFDPSDFPEDQIFLLTVDGVHFTINEPRVNNPGSHWYDHKSHSAGLSYLVAVDVRTSRICWIDGPRPGECVHM